MHYASKAFLCTEVARWVADEGLGLDVCSDGELATAVRADFPADRIAMHGNNKSPAELDAALDAGVGKIVLDSFAEVARLDDAARRRGVVADVMVRVTVGVEAHTHEFIATAHEDQKFGFSLAGGDAAEAVRRVLKSAHLRLVGLHSHIGSQIFDSGGFELAARRVVGAARRDPCRARRARGRRVGDWSTSAAAWASPTPPPTSPAPRRGWRGSCTRSSSASAGGRASRCRGSPSSPGARSPGPARSRSTPSARSRTSSSAAAHGGATSASTAG